MEMLIYLYSWSNGGSTHDNVTKCMVFTGITMKNKRKENILFIYFMYLNQYPYKVDGKQLDQKQAI